ncbi:MAG: all-trans-retinol 13,14-reductase [Flavobacteriaceae bacterium]|uniref:phytoene desaturase family protein n=1 Tax=Leeuwenhoekiella sp. UBA1003 TaxID=1946744 RepID=UPI000C95D97E|nr:NAD(P)/FAD-dependent oxidoreductase [Leeuwenhoekiella sp. UBA1003]MAT90033.1 all-trans-retinol 13,14-reductase [Flavobacteriaceae bacterium]|tara:strand:- start:1386 stop:2927 length:1542 start_codon:yes stop_codon:yes gene_type:complete
MTERFDVIVMGSGLGGLVSALILAKEGRRVCVLEKNQQFGGNLQTFSRNKTIFDTGVHYIGGLSEGQNLYRYFDYLGVMEDLNLKQMNIDGFDVVTFDGDPEEYPYAQGYENFISTLVEKFPEEEEGIRGYCNAMREMCGNFPLYELGTGKPYFEDGSVFGKQVKEHINSFTSNEKLQAVLGGTNLLYAGDDTRTPFYVHALSVNSYIESAYRCVNGGSQISKILLKRLRELGSVAYKRSEVTEFNYTEGQLTGVTTLDGRTFEADTFISNINPKRTLEIAGSEKFRKAYVNRIASIPDTCSAFSLYIVLKPNCFPYLNKNYYHFKDASRIWNAQEYTQDSWPESYMVSMGVNKNTEQYGDTLTAMTYMRYDEVATWEKTFNTVVRKNERGQTYEAFKKEKTEIFIDELEKKFPDIRECISAVYTSTPLSYRDYIGNHRGCMYGYEKDIQNPLRSFISPRTKINNLFFTGQSLNMHGILGVTISAVITCSEILGGEYLIEKIQEATSTINSVN